MQIKYFVLACAKWKQKEGTKKGGKGIKDGLVWTAI